MSIVAINNLARLLDVSGAFSSGMAPVFTADGVFVPSAVLVMSGGSCNVSGGLTNVTQIVFSNSSDPNAAGAFWTDGIHLFWRDGTNGLQTLAFV